MKLKCRPEDFQVQEEADVRPGSKGRYGLFELEKRNLSTFEAISLLARHLGKPPKAISAGGLKDKYALTRQHLTVAGKPIPPVRIKGLRLRPLGRVDEPMTGRQLRGNRFKIVLRDIAPEAIALVRERAQRAGGLGLPNYFDEQRFGSMRGGEGFIARKLIDGDYEGALRLHLATPSRLDAPKARARRKRLAALWGDWDAAFAALPRGNDRSVVTFLRDHPHSFARAFELIEPRLAQLYLFAYQSYIWNEVLARVLAARLPAGSLVSVRYAAGRLTFYDSEPGGSADALGELEIPLPSRKADYGDGDLANAAAESLAAEEIGLQDFRLKGMRKLRFRAGERRAAVTPSALRVGRDSVDDLYAGRRKLALEFSLPPGSYATLLVKYVGRELLPGSRAARSGRKRRGRRR